jgi:O-antigen/teichoic acid export membrane protein
VPETPSPDSLLVRTARGAGWVMAWRLGMRALGLISTLVLVRLIQPADFGIIALATSFMQTIDGMLTLGTEEAIIRDAAPARGFYDEGPGWTDNPDRIGLIQAAIVGSLTYGVVLAGTWMLAGRPSGPETDVLALLRHTARR